jgi:small subunit ribosomal protein S9
LTTTETNEPAESADNAEAAVEAEVAAAAEVAAPDVAAAEVEVEATSEDTPEAEAEEAVEEAEAAEEAVAEAEAVVEVVEEAEAEAEAPAAAAPSSGREHKRDASASSTPRVRKPAPISQTTGRRKRAVARVRFRPGNGTITVNRRTFEGYFTSATHRMIVSEPLRLTTIADRYDIDATIDGGGMAGQAGALRLGITRALIKIDPELRTSLKRAGLLTRDAREKESKKYGLKKARKAPQYSKR